MVPVFLQVMTKGYFLPIWNEGSSSRVFRTRSPSCFSVKPDAAASP